MARLNEAYEVLRLPELRRAYDRELAGESSPGSPGLTEPEPAETFPPSPGSRAATSVLTPTGPAKMPWRVMGIVAIVGSAVVLASAAFTDSPADEAPDGILRVGSCVEIEPNLDVREVDCSTSPDLVVQLMLPTGATCPQPYMTHRDRLGLGTACVAASE